MNKKLLAGLSLAGLSVLLMGIRPAQKLEKAKALDEEVGSFTVLAGSDYTANATTLSTTTGSFVAKAETGDEFHFSANLLQTAGQNDQFGVVLNGTYEDGHLSGDVIRLWLNGSTWWMEHGTLENDVYDLIHHSTTDFGTNWSGQLDLYVYNGMVAFRMDNWSIGGFELVNTSGDAFLYSNSVNFSVQNPTISALTSKIGNYLYRGQTGDVNWRGWNHHGYTYCYGSGTNHSFTMTLPNSLDASTVTKLILARASIQRTGGQEADVQVNGVAAGSFVNNASNSQRFTDYELELPLSLIASTKTLNIVVNVTGSELVAHNYRLMYETAEGRFAADHLILHSAVSETRHNYTHSALGWNDHQYLFMDINNNYSSTCYYWAGVTPGKAVLKMNNFDLWSGSTIAYNFTSNNAHTINFLDFINMYGATAWSFRNELWLNIGPGPYNSGSYVGVNSYEFPAAATEGHYWLDFFLDNMDASIGSQDRKFTIQGSIAITIDNLAIVKAFCAELLSTTESFASKTAEQKSAAWSHLASEYAKFNDDQISIFKTSDDDDIEAARDRYSCIVSRNYAGLADFVSSGASSAQINAANNNVGSPIILVISAIAAVIAFSLVLVKKAKKEY